MKRFLLFLACCLSMGVSAEMFEIPGTNISIDKPDNFHLAETGSYLVDDTGEMMVSLNISETNETFGNDAFKGVFKDIHAFRKKHFKGDIGYRVRHEHGGGYDGWSLVAEGQIKKKRYLLHLIGSNTGEYSESKMTLLKNLIESVEFNNQSFDVVEAVGLQIQVNGFKPIIKESNQMFFESPDKSKILVIPIPVRQAGESEMFAKCENLAITINTKAKNFPTDEKGVFSCQVGHDGTYQFFTAISKSTIQIMLISKSIDTEKQKRDIRQAIKNITLLRK